MDIGAAAKLVKENRGLVLQTETDAATIALLKKQYDDLAAGVESMVEDHRRIERELAIRADKAERACKEMEGLLQRAADLIMQAFRAREGDTTPETMPPQTGRHIQDSRMPELNPAH